MTRSARFNWIDAILLLLLLGVAAILVLPVYMGRVAMAHTHQWLQGSGDLVRYVTVLEQRGWWSSKLVADVRLLGADAERWYIDVVHGPIYLGMLARGRSPLISAAVSMRRGSDPVAVMEIVSRYNGDWAMVMSGFSVDLNTPGTARTAIALSGIRADVDFDARDATVALRADLDRASGAALELQEIAILGQYRLDIASGWPYGQTSIRAGRGLGASRSALIEGAELSVSNTRDAGQLGFNVSARLEGLPYGDASSPGVLTLDASLRGMSAELLKRWLLEDSSRSDHGRLLAGTELLVRNAELYSQRFSELARGELSAVFPTADSYRVTGWLDIAREAATQMFRDEARTMLGRSELFGKLNEVDEVEQGELAETSAIKQLDVLTAAGYLQLTAERYRTRFEFADGSLALNGKSIALP